MVYLNITRTAAFEYDIFHTYRRTEKNKGEQLFGCNLLPEFLMWPPFEIFCSFKEPRLLITEIVYEYF